MSRRTKIVVGCIVTCGLAAALLVWFGARTQKNQSDGAACWGALTQRDLAKLDVREGKKYTGKEQERPGSPYGAAKKNPRCGIQRAGKDNTFLASVDVIPGSELSPWGRAATSAGSYGVSSPIGSNVNGWTSVDMKEEYNAADAFVKLPASCGRHFKVGEKPVQVRLSLHDVQHRKWGQDSTRKRMGQVVVKAAAGIARSHGCAVRNLKLHEPVVGDPKFTSVAKDRACGLAGFDVVANESERRVMEQRVVGKLSGTWGCSVIGKEELKSQLSKWKNTNLQSFAVTKNQDLISEYEKGPRRDAKHHRYSRVIDCNGRKRLVQSMYPNTEMEEPLKKSKEILKPSSEMFEKFTDTVKRSLKCH